jgi:hypothetical protein
MPRLTSSAANDSGKIAFMDFKFQIKRLLALRNAAARGRIEKQKVCGRPIAREKKFQFITFRSVGLSGV